MVDKDTLRTIVSGYCPLLPRLCTLPSELLEMIRHHSRHGLLWRCIPALQLAAHVSATKPEPLLTVSLRELLSWECGGKLERVTASQSPLTTLRLSVDSVDISKVERLPGPLPYAGECTSRAAFIVQDEASILGVTAQLKDRRLRLRFHAGAQPMLPIWNTHAPPSLTLCKASPPVLASCQALYAVEMDRVKGITFFFSNGLLFGIHGHRSEESCAADTFTRLHNFLRRSIVWIYLPISECDRALVLGIREALQTRDLSIFVRTERIGDVIIGLQCGGNDDAKNQCLAVSAPVTMIYGEPKEGRAVRFFGAHCRRALDQPLLEPFRLAKPGPSPIDKYAYFSCAPLRGVSSTLVFYDQSTGFCRGIVLRYDNGGSRAVGQCRLQVDPAERVARPARLCFRADSSSPRRPNRKIYTVQVKFKQSSPTNDSDIEGWESRPMDGLVKFWFTHESSVLVVES
ncbi:hypothetical protein C8A01DRAFT_45719 [Parachaetomium inaequale]|uniref:Uncharacterized protein n=1 Tax=Parachaetomium inaequale TaxID=2588326 RepID=A0AAN6PHZ3_9PEZI|nr:hypothetical protein C8A01DRAFT_45719 [Parachaetomium inaequale]